LVGTSAHLLLDASCAGVLSVFTHQMVCCVQLHFWLFIFCSLWNKGGGWIGASERLLLSVNLAFQKPSNSSLKIVIFEPSSTTPCATVRRKGYVIVKSIRSVIATTDPYTSSAFIRYPPAACVTIHAAVKSGPIALLPTFSVLSSSWCST
jgi:hypothetical protein